MDKNIFLWIGFNVFIVIMVLFDTLLLNRKPKALSIRNALWLTGFWVALAAFFGLGIYFLLGTEYALEFATGYIIEQSLSVDNLFVILLLFTFFQTPEESRQKVLMWGILGAIFFRIIFILAGISLISRFQFVTYILGAFLIITSLRMLFGKDKPVQPDKNIAIKWFRKIMPVSGNYQGNRFFIRQNHIWYATPLWVALLVIETTDIVFAIDSIPAVIAVSTHPFIIYSSNIFAVLGLRALFFALSGVMGMFHFLKYGLAVILVFIGLKIVLGDILSANHIHIDIKVDLGFIGGVLLLSVLASMLFPEKGNEDNH